MTEYIITINKNIVNINVLDIFISKASWLIYHSGARKPRPLGRG